MEKQANTDLEQTLATMLFAVGRSPEAGATAGHDLERRVATEGSDRVRRLWQGLVACREERFADACDSLEKAVAHGCDDWRVRWALARAAKECGRLEVVDRHCAAVLESEPEFWFARELPRHARGYYAQLGQDRVIERFFADFPPATRTFVEVGAFDGVHYSNVRRLTEAHGWSGYSLEPVGKNYRKLCAAYAGKPVRCLKVAASDHEGEAEINVASYPHLPEWGCDVASLSAAEKDRWKNYSPVWTRERVPLVTLSSLLEREGCRGVDLLSVDAEGHDLAVLAGLDFDRWAPRMIVVEYGTQREEILAFLVARNYTLLEDNGQDLIVARIDHGLTVPGLPPTRNYTGASGAPPYQEIQQDMEHRLHRVLRRKPADVRRIVVVGGYLGLEVRHFLENYPHARIDVFEPSRRYFTALQRTYGDNARVHCHAVAVGERDGTMTFHEGTMEGVGSLLPLKDASCADDRTWLPEKLRAAEAYDVPTVRLDGFAPLRDAEVDLLWCDVQGVELQVLRGATELLRRTEAVFLEVATTKTTYQGQCLLGDLNAELGGRGFHLAGIGLCHTGNGTGNALWLRRDRVEQAPEPVALTDARRAGALARLNPHLLTCIPAERARALATIDAERLFQPQRFDLAAKVIYARDRLAGGTGDWPRRLYLAHVQAFNGGREGDGAGKEGAAAFLAAFDAVIDSVRDGGFDPDVSLVPVGGNGLLIDGAHRVAAAVACSQPVSCVLFDWESKAYDWEFFAARGLPTPCLDAMAVEFCRQREDAFIAILFPAAARRAADARAILAGHGRIFYEKEIPLNERGTIALTRQVYRDEPWLGTWSDRFAGARGKAQGCFPGTGPVRVIAFQADDLAAVRRAKTEIRQLCRVENHSVHINDNHAEAVRLARLFFNDNSIHFLNTAQPEHFPRFWGFFAGYRRMLLERGLDAADFCVDGSAVMALYGIRDAQDLDFLHAGDAAFESGVPGVNDHNSEAHHHAVKREDILGDPANHFFYEGIKFASLETIRRLKVKRNEGKDRADVEAIDRLLAGTPRASLVGRAAGLAAAARGRASALARRARKNLYERPKRRLLERFGRQDRRFSFPNNWFSAHEKNWNELLLPWAKNRGPLRVLEVGSYDGQSACWLLQSLLADPRSRLTCVDMWQQRSGDRVFEEDMEQVFQRFQRNCRATGRWDQVRVLRGDSRSMLQSLAGEQFDLIYIDGDHSEEGVRRDSLLCLPLLAAGGLVLWDDYNWCESVRDGVNRACSELQIPLESFGNNVCHRKPPAEGRRGAALPAATAGAAPRRGGEPARVAEARPDKIVGLVPARNEEARIGLCLRALARFCDAIVFLDDCSTDRTVEVVQSLAAECRVERIVRNDRWMRDEPGDRNRLLEAGRQVGGTHFVVLDADEAFTANLQDDGLLRRQILSLAAGERLSLAWIQLWRSLDVYRYDDSVWTHNYKCFAFADDGVCSYRSEFIHTSRVPADLKGAEKRLPGYTYGVLHFQFVNWRALLLKQAWYRCLERVRTPDRPVEAINRLYAPSKDESGLRVRPAPEAWLAGYPFFDRAAAGPADNWRAAQIREWFLEHGREYFAGLDIWDAELDLEGQLARAADERADGAPVVSAIVSAYASARFLRGCLEDLEAQTIADRMEIIVVDSGSPDDEEAIVREFQGRFGNIVYLRTERETVYAAWNRGIRLARGRYLTNANTDDRHAPDAFERMVAVLDSRPEAGLVYANCAVTRTPNTSLHEGPVVGHFRWPAFDPRLLFSVCYVGPQPMWRRSLHGQFGLFDPGYTSAGDYEFWLRICRKVKFVHIPEVLGLYLTHEGSIEHATPEVSHREAAQARRRHWPAEWGALPRTGGGFLQAAPVVDATPLRPIAAAAAPAPTVSVIVPTRGDSATLTAALRSVLDQTFQDFEIVVVDDGGPDVGRLLDGLDARGRIVALRQPMPRGRAAGRNAGLAAARGRSIAYLDDHDRFHPDHLESLVGLLRKTGAKVAYSDAVTGPADHPGGTPAAADRPRQRSAGLCRLELLVANAIPLGCVLHARECLEASGPFDPSLVANEDWDFLIRLSRHFDMAALCRATIDVRAGDDGGIPSPARVRDLLRSTREIHARYRMYAEGDDALLGRQEAVQAGLRRRIRGGFQDQVTGALKRLWSRSEDRRLAG